jgi:cysteine desulfurase
MPRKIYLDNAATTKVAPEVVREMNRYFTEYYGNASSLHSAGRLAAEALATSRTTIAKAIGAKPEEIIFTSGGTESDNLAIKGIALAAREREKKTHIITSKIEHPAVLNTCEALGKLGFKITHLNVDREGFVDLEQLADAIDENTALVSVMHANNEIGTIEPIEEIGKICAEHDVPFHTDAVQSFTKVPIDVRKQRIALASLSGHKIHGPKGIGALYVKNGLVLQRQMDGGGHERGLRAGTENVPGAVGMATAVKLCKSSHVVQMTKLRDLLIDRVLSEIPDSRLNGSRGQRLCNNANFCFMGVEGEAVGTHLDLKGICSSVASACASKSLKPSHVLLALGLKPEEAAGSLRLSLSRYTTKEEIDYVLEVLPSIISKLRAISPLKSWISKL